MPKLKTRKAVKKRFKITGTGKLRYNAAGKRHILESKSSKRKRKMRGWRNLAKGDLKRTLKALAGSK